MKNRPLVISLFLLIIVGLGLFAWVNSKSLPLAVETGKIEVVASFYPLAFFAEQIGTDRVNVTNLTPSGVEPHDFEPSTKDLAQMERSQLILINGAGFEPWADRFEQLQPLAVAGTLANLEILQENVLVRDPHVWLDPVLAQKEVEIITAALIQIDPAGKAVYLANQKNLTGRLIALGQEFRAGLANCRQDKIVTSHAAFTYLAARYGLTQVALAGLSPDSEPTPREFTDLIKQIREQNIKYIFFESLVSPRLAQTLASETGAGTLVLNPLEGLTTAEAAAGQDYFSIQRGNLSSLRLALECQ